MSHMAQTADCVRVVEVRIRDAATLIWLDQAGGFESGVPRHDADEHFGYPD